MCMIHRIEENTLGKPADEAVFASQYLDGRYCRPDEVAESLQQFWPGISFYGIQQTVSRLEER